MLKLNSICIGPFLINPDTGRGMKVEIKMYNFYVRNLLDKDNVILDKINFDKRNSLSKKKDFQP